MGAGSTSCWEVYVSVSLYTGLPTLTFHSACQKQQKSLQKTSGSQLTVFYFFYVLPVSVAIFAGY